MRILHIIDSLGLGGAQTLVRGIFEAQQDNNEIFLFALRKRDIGIIIQHKNVYTHGSTSKYSLKPLLSLRDLIRREKIDVLHCHLFRSQVFGYLLKMIWFKDIKLIFHEHGEIFEDKFVYRAILGLLEPRVNIFLSVSKATKQKLVERVCITEQKVRILFNYVDLDKFKKRLSEAGIMTNRKKLGINDNEIIIGFSGRLSPIKGCEYLIRSIPFLKVKAKLLIAGDGILKDELMSLAEVLCVKEGVIFLGQIEDIASFYEILDILVVPSLYESFGLSAVEAQAMGVLVIASDVEGLNEVVINNETGLLFEPKNYEGLAQKIEQIMSKDSIALKDDLKTRALMAAEKFSLKKYLVDLDCIYDKSI